MIAIYINPLEPKNIKLEKQPPNPKFLYKSFTIYVAIALRPTAYIIIHPLNTWIPFFFYFLYIQKTLIYIETSISQVLLTIEA